MALRRGLPFRKVDKEAVDAEHVALEARLRAEGWHLLYHNAVDQVDAHPKPPPDLHSGRWQNRAAPAATAPSNSEHQGRWEERASYGGGGAAPADHASRWEERARWGDAPEVSDGQFDAKAAMAQTRRRVNSGRWQQRAAFGELSLHDPARHPVGGPGRQARERWERGGYLLQERGVAEGGYDQNGVWVSGRWQQRAQWAYEDGRGATGRPKNAVKEHQVPGPYGQRPIGPANEDKRAAGVWEARGAVAHEHDHRQLAHDRHVGRWEGRVASPPAGGIPVQLHQGRWENRAASGGGSGTERVVRAVVGGEPVRTLPNKAERFPLAAVAGEDRQARQAPHSHLMRNQYNSVDQHRHHNFRIGA